MAERVMRDLLIFCMFSFCCCFEPISTVSGIVGGVGLSLGYAGWKYARCKFSECCEDPWIKLNYSGLQSDFRRMLHGQHLIETIVPRTLKGHVSAKNPKKALVMAFHGNTGTGKNFVSKIIAENLYREGFKSNYVHLYIATQHFPHEAEVQQYRSKLQKEIKDHTSRCGQSLFIFDEMDKMPEGVIDILKPYIDYYESIDGIDYRRNIFIFLSDAGSSEINRIAFNAWLNGESRENITMKDIEPVINRGAFNEKGGLKYSSIVKKNLINVYVPFLPLEKKHVEMCIRDALRERSLPVNDDDVREIASMLQYYPEEFYLYSASGCKRITQKIDEYLDD